MALSSGAGPVAYLTSAGIGVAAIAILGAAIVKVALLAQEESRHKRSAVEELAAIDEYFETIAAMDVDDCGKLLVCQLEAVPAEVFFCISKKRNISRSCKIFRIVKSTTAIDLIETFIVDDIDIVTV